jgi:hypothetical protein
MITPDLVTAGHAVVTVHLLFEIIFQRLIFFDLEVNSRVKTYFFNSGNERRGL